MVLDNIRSAANVGSIFRSADSFNIQGIMICGISARPPHAEIRKTALGADETVAWVYESDIKSAILKMKSAGFEIACLEQTSASVFLHDFHPPRQINGLALILGNEVQGVQDELLQLCDSFLEIEQFGSKHSLNVAVAAGIALFELNKKAPRLSPDALINIFG